MSSLLPVETVDRLEEYLWWLLPDFLKKRERAESLVAQFCGIWGDVLDVARTTLTDIIPQLVVDSASGEYLDRLARSRQIFRGEDETDESLRIRVLAAYTIKQKAGTIPGMQDGLAAIGYAVEVDERQLFAGDPHPQPRATLCKPPDPMGFVTGRLMVPSG